MSVIWINTAKLSVSSKTKIPYPYYNKGLKYSGAELSPEWINYDPEQLTIGGTFSATEKGRYVTTFTVKEGFCWGDYTTGEYSVEWYVFEEVVEYPKQTTIPTYNNDTITPSWTTFNHNMMEISGETKATDAGTYSCSFKLKDGYGWVDGSREVYSTSWKINKAICIKNLSASSLSLSLANKPTEILTLYFDVYGGGYEWSYDRSIVKLQGVSEHNLSYDLFNVTAQTIGTTTVIFKTQASKNFKESQVSCIITVTA
jgi:hypothetical protein